MHLRLKTLTIKGFRNLRDVMLTLPTGKLLAFAGKNGQGKTNLLEAIFLCGLSKSFRTSKNQDLVGFDEDFCRITVEPEDSRIKTLEVIITKNPADKVLKVNGVKKAASDFVGHLPLVFFSPDDMSELAHAPSSRRRYLNVLLSQVDRDYLETLMRYNHLLYQRNTLLRKIRDGKTKEKELEPWDELLIPLGITLITKRATVTQALYPLVPRFYKALAGTSDELNLGYLPSSPAEELAEKLVTSRKRDIATGVTNIGPHRDDLRFLFNEHDMPSFASRGEWRSLVLALKLAEKEWLTQTLSAEPLLLLDDVFSELDEERQKYLMASLGSSQVFLTTTHLEFLDGIAMPKAVYEIQEGAVS
ncbi:MAG: DNA replication/repair protein RecF [Candidatus Peregrinibacteria bacterium]